MKSKSTPSSKRYRSALKTSLMPGGKAGIKLTSGLGAKALTEGLNYSELLKIHEEVVIEVLALADASGTSRKRLIERSFRILSGSIAVAEKARRANGETAARLKLGNETLKRKLAAASRSLKGERERQKAAERLRNGREKELMLSKNESLKLHQQLRRLSHQFLRAQEQERKTISRELHDQIAQTLTGINVHLAALKAEDATNSRELAKKILKTQRLVERSVKIVHQFARELRPTILDDLGLVAALKSHLKEFTKQTGISVRLTSVPEIERLSDDKRTVLYRVAQAALSNVSSHANASSASILISKSNGHILMKIQDNGKGFDVERVLFAKRHKRLGVLGMRERVEMVGGTFTIESLSGKGTTLEAQIPFRK